MNWVIAAQPSLLIPDSWIFLKVSVLINMTVWWMASGGVGISNWNVFHAAFCSFTDIWIIQAEKCPAFYSVAFYCIWVMHSSWLFPHLLLLGPIWGYIMSTLSPISKQWWVLAICQAQWFSLYSGYEAFVFVLLPLGTLSKLASMLCQLDIQAVPREIPSARSCSLKPRNIFWLDSGWNSGILERFALYAAFVEGILSTLSFPYT